MRTKTLCVVLTGLVGLGASAAAIAETISINLSGVAAGDYTVLDVPGERIGQIFSGQAVIDTGIAPPITPPATVTGVSGSPTGPLALASADTLHLSKNPMLLSECSVSTPEWFGSKGIDGSPTSGPISILLDQEADEITWHMGSGHGGSVEIDLFAIHGILDDPLRSPRVSGPGGPN